MSALEGKQQNPFGGGQPSVGALVSVEQQRAIAEVQASMVVARSMPRNQLRALDRILQECTNPELAEEATYAYNRGGSEVEAPSIRLAETMARHWGNLMCGVRELSRREGYSECQSYAQDLETGYKEERTFQVRHWRDTKGGGYAVDDERDIYEVVANSGARRKRSCILALIPLDVQAQAMRACEQTLAAKGEITAERIEAMLARFGEFKVTKEMIEKRIGRTLESVPAVVFMKLQRIYTSLRDKMSDVGDWFEAPEAAAAKPEAKTGAAALKRAAQAKAKAAARAAPTPVSVLADVKKCCEAALKLEAMDVALLKLDDAKDLARVLEGKEGADAAQCIGDTQAALDAKFAPKPAKK